MRFSGRSKAHQMEGRRLSHPGWKRLSHRGNTCAWWDAEKVNGCEKGFEPSRGSETIDLVASVNRLSVRKTKFGFILTGNINKVFRAQR